MAVLASADDLQPQRVDRLVEVAQLTVERAVRRTVTARQRLGQQGVLHGLAESGHQSSGEARVGGRECDAMDAEMEPAGVLEDEWLRRPLGRRAPAEPFQTCLDLQVAGRPEQP